MWSVKKGFDKMKNPPVAAVDFDGTICFTDMTKPYIPKTPIIGEPNIKLIEMLRGMKREGWKILIHTSRWSGEYNWIKKWLDDNDVPYDGIEPHKLKADMYIDDKAWNPFHDNGY
jgi:uncharacterized HAD superfamily protein